MAKIQMYTTRWCGYCVRAKVLLDGKGLPYEEISLDDDPHFRQHTKRACGQSPPTLLCGAAESAP